MPTLNVNIVTPNGIIYTADATLIVVKTTDGELGILPEHAPIIVPLEIGEVRVQETGKPEEFLAVNGGVMEVRDDVCTIIADSAEDQGNIDTARAERAKNRAERRIEEAKRQQDVVELKRAEISLRRAINRIDVASRH